jgi:hypothetical protein
LTFEKMYTAGIRSAVAILLSFIGLGSAMGQANTDDWSMRANSIATRERIRAEIVQAKDEGKIKRWAPILYTVPLNTRAVDAAVMTRLKSGSPCHPIRG